MWRKRATSAPAFKVPAAYNPLTGQHAPLGRPVERTRIAMMQVAAEDTHDNYLVCRGYDPECGKFFDYEAGTDKKGINVAKPYGIRGTKPYVVGQVFAAAKPKTRLGDTPGKAETTVGHPADLDEEVVILTDDDSNPIAWLDIGASVISTKPYYNDYAGTVPKYGCVAVTGVKDITDPADSIYELPKCNRPSSTIAEEYLLSAEEVKQSGVGPYQNDGEMVLVRYETGTPALDETWVPKAGQFELVKGAAGAPWGVVVAGIYDATAKILMGRVAKSSSRIRWGLVQSANPTDPFENGQATLATLLLCYVRSCASDGTGGETGSAFTVKIPARACKDTSLFTGYVVGYLLDDAGDKIIVTDCYDDPIGTVKAWDTTAAIRDGWTELTGAIGRFLVGCETGETWDTPGDTGGADLNNLTAGLQDHPGHPQNCLGDIAAYGWALHSKLDGTSGTLNHRLSDDGTATGAGTLAPPWYAVKWIKRTS